MGSEEWSDPWARQTRNKYKKKKNGEVRIHLTTNTFNFFEIVEICTTKSQMKLQGQLPQLFPYLCVQCTCTCTTVGRAYIQNLEAISPNDDTDTKDWGTYMYMYMYMYMHAVFGIRGFCVLSAE